MGCWGCLFVMLVMSESDVGLVYEWECSFGDIYKDGVNSGEVVGK